MLRFHSLIIQQYRENWTDFKIWVIKTRQKMLVNDITKTGNRKYTPISLHWKQSKKIIKCTLIMNNELLLQDMLPHFWKEVSFFFFSGYIPIHFLNIFSFDVSSQKCFIHPEWLWCCFYPQNVCIILYFVELPTTM